MRQIDLYGRPRPPRIIDDSTQCLAAAQRIWPSLDAATVRVIRVRFQDAYFPVEEPAPFDVALTTYDVIKIPLQTYVDDHGWFYELGYDAKHNVLAIREYLDA